MPTDNCQCPVCGLELPWARGTIACGVCSRCRALLRFQDDSPTRVAEQPVPAPRGYGLLTPGGTYSFLDAGLLKVTGFLQYDDESVEYFVEGDRGVASVERPAGAGRQCVRHPIDGSAVTLRGDGVSYLGAEFRTGQTVRRRVVSAAGALPAQGFAEGVIEETQFQSRLSARGKSLLRVRADGRERWHLLDASDMPAPPPAKEAAPFKADTLADAGGTLYGAQTNPAGKPCPNCAYVRTATDSNPAWQCPRCQVALVKYRPAAAQLGVRLAAGGRELAAEAKADRSVYVLIAANLFTAVVALALDMTLRDLLVVYWIQSVVIGLSFLIRLLSLEKFTTGTRSDDGQPIAGTAGDKYSAAVVFLIVYGFMHCLYFMFVVFDPKAVSRGASSLGLWLCALVFAANHTYSLVHNLRLDRLDNLKLSALNSLPYMRILPMHIAVVMGAGIFRPTTTALVVFVIFKTAADVLMHTIEHHELRQGSSLRKLGDYYFDR